MGAPLGYGSFRSHCCGSEDFAHYEVEEQINYSHRMSSKQLLTTHGQ